MTINVHKSISGVAHKKRWLCVMALEEFLFHGRALDFFLRHVKLRMSEEECDLLSCQAGRGDGSLFPPLGDGGPTPSQPVLFYGAVAYFIKFAFLCAV